MAEWLKATDCKSVSNTYIGSNPISFRKKGLVIVVQLVERQTVTLNVMGSNPFFYPILKNVIQKS